MKTKFFLCLLIKLFPYLAEAGQSSPDSLPAASGSLVECVDSGVSGVEPDAVDKVSYLPEEDTNSLAAGEGVAFLCSFLKFFVLLQFLTSLCSFARPCTGYRLMVWWVGPGKWQCCFAKL